MIGGPCISFAVSSCRKWMWYTATKEKCSSHKELRASEREGKRTAKNEIGSF